jgi:hypothetical protein
MYNVYDVCNYVCMGVCLLCDNVYVCVYTYKGYVFFIHCVYCLCVGMSVYCACVCICMWPLVFVYVYKCGVYALGIV